MNIGILIVATGRYISFADNLVKSINKNFLQNIEKTIYVFTDGIPPEGTIKCPVDHMKWPYPTLYRYRFFLKYEEQLKVNDYVYYIDADSDVVGIVDEEIIGDFVVTPHVSSTKYKHQNNFPYETRKESTAYIDSNTYKEYYTGSFWGGKTEYIMNMCRDIDKNIQIDENNNIIAKWHDESHLNKFCVTNIPTKILNEGYCYRRRKKFPYPKRIIPASRDNKENRDY